MSQPAARMRTRAVARVTAPPADGGWQVTYEIGVQGGGLVITSVKMKSATGTDGSVPRGGLTAELARSLMRPGAARAELIKEPTQRRWRVEFALDFVRFLDRYVAAPAIPASATRGLNREQRLAVTAKAYVEAPRAGASKPPEGIAAQQKRSTSKMRDHILA